MNTNQNKLVIVALAILALAGIGASIWVLVDSEGASTTQTVDTANQTPSLVVENVYASNCSTAFNGNIYTGPAITGGSNPVTVCIEGTATDPDGCATITAIEGKILRSTATGGSSCTESGSDCYDISDIALDGGTCSGGTDTPVDFSGTVDIEWWAHQTQYGTESSYYWNAWAEVTDDEPATGAGWSPNFEVNRTNSLSVTPGTLGFGTRDLNTTGPNPSDIELELVNLSNEIVDVEQTTANWFDCTVSGPSSLNMTVVHWNWVDTWTYGTGDYIQGNSWTQATDADIPKSTDGTTTTARKTAYHMIALPGSGISGICTNVATWNARPN